MLDAATKDALCRQGKLKDFSGTIATTGTSQAVIAQNSNRRYLLVQNKGANPMYVDFTAAATTDAGILIAAGTGFVWDSGFIPIEALNILGTSGDHFTVKEG